MIELTEQEMEAEIRRQLEALGIGEEGPSPDDLVHAALVAAWKEHHRPPRLCSIAREVNVAETSLQNILRRLLKNGRVLYAGKGKWVPVVV